MKKWLIIGVGTIALLAMALAVSYRTVLSKNFLVTQIESSINSRVQIGELDVDVFSVPAKVVISEVIITERDDQVRDEVPHDDRPKLEDGEVKAGSISFDVSLWELFSRQLKVSELKIVAPHSNVVMNEAGELNISYLFAAPPGTETQITTEKEDLNAKENASFVTELDLLTIADGSFNMVIEETGLEIAGSAVNLQLSEIKVDPEALEQVNEAHLEFAAFLEAFSSKEGRTKYGQIGLQGPARVRLFDPATGNFEPDTEIDFSIDESSYISTRAPYVEKLWKVTEKLEKIGVETNPPPEKLTFGGERKLKASYRNNRVELHKPVSLVMIDWELVLAGESWVEIGTEEHESGVQLIAGAAASEYVREKLEDITEKAPKKVRTELQEKITEQIFIDDRLTLKLSTSGPLSDPKVTLETRIPDAADMVKDYAKKRVLDFLIDKLK